MRSIFSCFLGLVLCSSLIFLLFTAPSSLECKRDRSGTTNKSRQVKHSRIVQNVDIPGDGVAGRVQCNNESVGEMVTSSCSNSLSSTLVSLFIPPVAADDPCDNVLVGGKVLLKSERPYAVLQAFTESAVMFMPNSQQVLLTAHNARLPTEKLLPGVVVEYLPGNYSRSNLMLQRLQSYVTYLDLQLTRPGRPTGGFVFTDSDMIIVGDLGCVFSDHPDIDVALTFRNNREQPVNSGMVFVRATEESIRKGKQLLLEVLETFRRDFTRASRMMGDQLAFAKVVVSGISGVEDLFRRGNEFKGDVNGVKVLFLPCLRYNWTPSEGAGQFHGMPLDVRTIHFKGSRKRLMLEAWGVHRHAKHKLACFVLRSGRAKYDF